MVAFKDISKFLSGVFVWDLFAHTWFALAGVLPISFITPELNNFVIIPADIILSIIFLYFGFFKK